MSKSKSKSDAEIAAESAAEKAIQKYELDARRAELDYPPTEEERKSVLRTWKKRLMYQTETNTSLHRNLDFLRRMFVFSCFVFAVMVVAIRVSDHGKNALTQLLAPEGQVFLRNAVLVTLFLVAAHREWLLFFQVYVINVATYVYAKVRGHVYRPYIVYGIA